MSDRIIESFNEMKQIYLGSISGNYIQKGNEYLNYITEGKKGGPGEEYEDEYKGTEKKAERDYDGDGTLEPKKHEYAGVIDRAIKKAKGNPYEDEEEDEDEEDTKSKKSKKSKKEKELDENFSNWRDELYEAIGDIESEIDASKQIVEKPVRNKIEINPTISVAEQVLSVEDLGENYIHDVVDLATEFFYENGINDVGIKLIAEQLGENAFTDYVFGIAEEFSLYEEYLYEKTRQQKELEKKGGAAPSQRATSGPYKGMHYSKLRQTDPEEFAKAIKRNRMHTKREKIDAEYIEKHGKNDPYIERSSRKGYSGPSQRQKLAKNITMDRGNIAIIKAKQTQPNKPIKKGLLHKALMAALNVADKGADALKAGIERHNTATKPIDNFLKKHNLAEALYLLEKATSEQQQKIFGLALSVKRGDTPRSKVSDEVLKIVDGMSEAEIRKFASTAHKGLPKRA